MIGLIWSDAVGAARVGPLFSVPVFGEGRGGALPLLTRPQIPPDLAFARSPSRSRGRKVGSPHRGGDGAAGQDADEMGAVFGAAVDVAGEAVGGDRHP